ncbi:hypothetical protein BLOT_006133 [Blomia tropicalis]|nr:hypothetical protein BLOT_006133 [Blomia tropicalis]
MILNGKHKWLSSSPSSFNMIHRHGTNSTNMFHQLVKVFLFNLIICWSFSSIIAYEIWSVYFDDTMPSSKDNVNRTRKQLFQVPFTQTRYLFQIDTFINENNLNHIVRMELSMCDEADSLRMKTLPSGSLFYNEENGIAYLCVQRIATRFGTMTANSTIVRYPQDVGLPLIPLNNLLLTIEYDDDYTLLNDNSGFELYISDNQLPYEAGIMALGIVPDNRFIVPANVAEWATRGTCHSSCFQYMEHDEMAIVSIFPSTGHRSLRELTLEVTAPDGMARKVFAWGGDTSIDNTEEIVFNAKERLNVNCIYSMSNRSITGGLDAITNENCLVWMHYYPKIELEACLSSYSAATIMSLLDVDDLNATMTHDDRIHVTVQGEPLEQFVVNKDRMQTWQMDKLARSQYSVINGPQIAHCGWRWDTSTLELRRRR